jgi:predicted nucleic acid-binding protein
VLDAGDADHERCTAMLRRSDEPRVVPAPVLVELDYFVPGHAFARFLEDARRGAFLIEELQPADYVRVQQLLFDYADLRVGFVDAAVLAVVERLRETRLATLDHRHFSVMRPLHTHALRLLPAT